MADEIRSKSTAGPLPARTLRMKIHDSSVSLHSLASVTDIHKDARYRFEIRLGEFQSRYCYELYIIQDWMEDGMYRFHDCLFARLGIGDEQSLQELHKTFMKLHMRCFDTPEARKVAFKQMLENIGNELDDFEADFKAAKRALKPRR